MIWKLHVGSPHRVTSGAECRRPDVWNDRWL